MGELWLVYQVTGSGFSLGLATALRTVPSLLMSPLAGVLADRYERKTLLRVSHLLKALITTIFWAVATYSDPGIASLYGLILLLGLITTFDAPIRRGFVRVIVPSELLQDAASLHTAVISVGRIIGPAIGGLLIGLFGTPSSFLANSICALFGFFILYRIKTTAIDHSTESSRKSFRSAVAYAWRTEELRITLAYLAVACLTVLNIEVILPIVTEVRLGGGSATLSALLVFLSVGSLLGSLGAAERRSNSPSFPWLLVVQSVVTILLAWAPTTPLVILSLILVGLTSGAFLGRANAHVQSVVEASFHGRIVAIYAMIFVGMRSLGNILMGFFVEHFGASSALRISALCNAAMVLSIFAITTNSSRIDVSPAIEDSDPEAI